MLLLSADVLAGCDQHGAQPPPETAPEVEVSVADTDLVTDYEDFPGRLDAVNTIQVRARVSGYLDKVGFKDGDEVKEGEVLFYIDSRPYDAELARAQASLVQSEAHLKRTSEDYSRAMRLLAQRSIGQEEYDKIAGDRAEAAAAVGVARASRDLAQLNVTYTKVKAPISGRLSRRFVDPGNLVKADDTALTSIVSLDPIYVYFDVDERTALHLPDFLREGKLNLAPEGGVPVLIGLANEKGFPHQGQIDFVDNTVDPGTGTLRLRGKFGNANRDLQPGLFVRVRLPIGKPYRAVLVAEQALARDQGQKYVNVVTPGNEVEYRRVEIGRLQKGMRVITSGLNKDERVVVSGLQKVRAKMKVEPKIVPMPKLEEQATIVRITRPEKPSNKQGQGPSTGGKK
jgi:RND family efflux transporter MFP subunit